MIAFIIILGILAFLFVLLLVPLRFSFHYGAETTVKAGYLFLNFTLYPKAEAPKQQAEEKTGEPAGGRFKSLKDKHGLMGLLEIFTEIAKILGSAAKGVLRHVKVKELDVYAVAGGENAAEAAVLYGQACGVIYTAVGLVRGACRCKRVGATVDADYKSEESYAICSAAFSIKPLYLAGHGLRGLFRLVPVLLKLRKA